MNIKKIIWLAGLFEGEGTTGLYKYKRREHGKEQGWRISSYFLICNNDPAIIWEVKQIARELGVNMTIFTRNQDSEKWNINYQILTKKMSDNYTLLEAIMPYLVGTKKYVGKMTMDFIENREFGKTRKPYSPEEESLYTKSKELNQRGKNKKLPESSEAIRQTLEKGDDMVQTSMKVGEGIQEEF